jgi:hypothetical protein
MAIDETLERDWIYDRQQQIASAFAVNEINS